MLSCIKNWHRRVKNKAPRRKGYRYIETNRGRHIYQETNTPREFFVVFKKDGSHWIEETVLDWLHSRIKWRESGSEILPDE